jgi:hypothetical protein
MNLMREAGRIADQLRRSLPKRDLERQAKGMGE